MAGEPLLMALSASDFICVCLALLRLSFEDRELQKRNVVATIVCF